MATNLATKSDTQSNALKPSSSSLSSSSLLNATKGNGSQKGERIALAPIKMNPTKLKKQPLGVSKSSSNANQALDSNQASKLCLKSNPTAKPQLQQQAPPPTSIVAPSSKSTKSGSFEIFCDEVVEEKQQKTESKVVESSKIVIVKDESKENAPHVAVVVSKNACILHEAPAESKESTKDDLKSVDMVLEDDDSGSDKSKEGDMSMSSQLSKSESVIMINTLSIDESNRKQEKSVNDKENQDDHSGVSSPSDDQVASIMSMLADDKEETEVLSFDEVILLNCKEYSEEIHIYLLDYETRFHPDNSYMPKQQDINTRMRSILVDWLAEVADEYKLVDETLFLAVNFIDRFLSNMTISRQSLQLLGTSSLFIASKYEEIYPPDINDFVYITDDSYNKQQVLSMEKLILKVLQFGVSTPTTHYFLTKYLSYLHVPKCVSHLAQYLCYLTLLEDDPFLKFYPSEIAFCSLIIAAHTYNLKGLDFTFYKHPSKRSQIVPIMEAKERKGKDEVIPTPTSEAIQCLQSCLAAVYNLHKFAPIHAQQFIRDKFSRDKFSRVAQVPAKECPPELKQYLSF